MAAGPRPEGLDDVPGPAAPSRLLRAFKFKPPRAAYAVSHCRCCPSGPSRGRALGVLPPQRIGEGGRVIVRWGEEPRGGRQVQAEIVQGQKGKCVTRIVRKQPPLMEEKSGLISITGVHDQ